MLRSIHTLTVLAILFLVCGIGPGVLAQPSGRYITPQMTDLIHAHQVVLQQMNAHEADGRLMDLSDPRMLPLLTEGWRVGGCVD